MFFFFNDTATTEIYTLSLHDALPIYTYAVSLQAFIYGFPYVYMAQVRHMWTTQPRNPELIPYTTINRFWHTSQVFTAEYQDGGSPNNDTMYSLAWVDVGEEPRSEERRV